MNFKKITSLVLSALVITSQINFETKAMKPGNRPNPAISSLGKPTINYVLDMISSMRDAYYDPSLLPTPYSDTQHLPIAELRVKTLAHDLLTILNEHKEYLNRMNREQRIKFDAKVYSVINRFLQIIYSLDFESETPRTQPLPELPELPDYLSKITPKFLASDEGILLISTIKFDDSYPSESDKPIPMTPHLQSLLLSFHFTKLFIEESFGRFLETDINLEDTMTATIKQCDNPLDVCYQMAFCCSDLLCHKLHISRELTGIPIYWTRGYLRQSSCAQITPTTDCITDSLQPDEFKDVNEIKEYVEKLAEDANTLLNRCNYGFLPSFEKKSSITETCEHMKQSCCKLGKFQINQFRKSWFSIITKLKYAIMCADTLEYGTLRPSKLSNAIVRRKLEWFKEDEDFYSRESDRIHTTSNLMMLFLCRAFRDTLSLEGSPFDISEDDLPDITYGSISDNVIYIFGNYICNKHPKDCTVCDEKDLAEFPDFFSGFLNTEDFPSGERSSDNDLILTMLSYLKHYGKRQSEEQ